MAKVSDQNGDVKCLVSALDESQASKPESIAAPVQQVGINICSIL